MDMIQCNRSAVNLPHPIYSIPLALMHHSLQPLQLHPPDYPHAHPRSLLAPLLRARVIPTMHDVPRGVLPPIHARPDGANVLQGLLSGSDEDGDG